MSIRLKIILIITAICSILMAVTFVTLQQYLTHRLREQSTAKVGGEAEVVARLIDRLQERLENDLQYLLASRDLQDAVYFATRKDSSTLFDRFAPSQAKRLDLSGIIALDERGQARGGSAKGPAAELVDEALVTQALASVSAQHVRVGFTRFDGRSVVMAVGSATRSGETVGLIVAFIDIDAALMDRFQHDIGDELTLIDEKGHLTSTFSDSDLLKKIRESSDGEIRIRSHEATKPYLTGTAVAIGRDTPGRTIQVVVATERSDLDAIVAGTRSYLLMITCGGVLLGAIGGWIVGLLVGGPLNRVLQLESAVSQTYDAIVIAAVDARGSDPSIVYVNPAFTQTFGHALTEAAGRSPELLAKDAPGREVVRRLLDAAARGEGGSKEMENTAKDGSQLMVDWRVAPIRDRDGRIAQVVVTLHDISARVAAETDLAEVHRRLLDASRKAGQAEVAAGVLHNVGNVLNSINVSTTLVIDRLRTSRIDGLGKAMALLESQRHDLGAFFGELRGRQLAEYLAGLTKTLEDEHRSTSDEMRELAKGVDHVKDIIGMQQAYARNSGFTVLVRPQELMEDALRIHAAGLERHHVVVARHYADVPELMIDKHRTMQILVNLVSNAKYAFESCPRDDRRLSLKVWRNAPDRVSFEVVDNGIGILAENLKQIFTHGFTTKPEGHGFGLHSSILAAQEMQGELRAQSEGLGRGATFTLELPA